MSFAERMICLGLVYSVIAIGCFFGLTSMAYGIFYWARSTKGTTQTRNFIRIVACAVGMVLMLIGAAVSGRYVLVEMFGGK